MTEYEKALKASVVMKEISENEAGLILALLNDLAEISKQKSFKGYALAHSKLKVTIAKILVLKNPSCSFQNEMDTFTPMLETVKKGCEEVLAHLRRDHE